VAHDFHYQTVRDFLVRPQKHLFVRRHGQGLQGFFEHGGADGRLIQKQAAVALDRQQQMIVVGGQGFRRLHPGQFHGQTFGHHGRRDHENDQQHKHHVHKGRHVDFRDEIVVG
jgi:hypothetical protein